MSWFRIHTGMIHHSVVQSLPPATFKAWVNILCLAKDGDGTVPAVSEIAFQLRCGLNFAERVTQELVRDYGLLERNEDGTFHPHNWELHQYKSDNVTERVRAFRERKRNVSETAPEYRVQSTDTEQSQKQTLASNSASPKTGSVTSQGSRLFLTELPLEWREWTSVNLHWDADRSRNVFQVFLDYWHGVPGIKGRKSDWFGTWRNWCRRDQGTTAAVLPFAQRPAYESATDRAIRVGLENVQRTGRL